MPNSYGFHFYVYSNFFKIFLFDSWYHNTQGLLNSPSALYTPNLEVRYDIPGNHYLVDL